VTQTEKLAVSVGPFAAALSGLADRMNLLALNVTLLATRAGEFGGPFEHSGTELRGLFEEARRLSRDLASLAQKAASTGRRAGEALGDILVTAEGAAESAWRTQEQLERLRDLGTGLSGALAGAQRAAEEGEEGRRRLHTSLVAAETALGTQSVALAEQLEEIEKRNRDLLGLLDLLQKARASGDALLSRLRAAASEG
jgi:methyl-accepting chemotaxis protein